MHDVQLLMGGQHQYRVSPDEYVFAAINIYLDIINLVGMACSFRDAWVNSQCTNHRYRWDHRHHSKSCLRKFRWVVWLTGRQLLGALG